MNLPEHLGPVSRQLLEQGYSEVPREQQSTGESKAMGVALRWLKEILAEPFWPTDAVRCFVHHGDGTSCDAVQHRYSIKSDLGELQISVFQTVFIFLVTTIVEPTGERNRDATAVASDVAHRLFKHSTQLNFAITNQGTHGAVGYQVSAAASSDCEWLDSLVWWIDGDLVGFDMLKQLGPGQAAIVSSVLEANRTWFASYESPRTG